MKDSFQNEWTEVHLHCPNCGKLLAGFQDNEGMTKISCIYCFSKIVSKKRTRRHHSIDVYAPTGQIAI